MRLAVEIAVWLCVVMVSVALGIQNDNHHEPETAFHRILEHLHGESSVSMLTPWSLDQFIDELFLLVGCNETTPSYCECLSSTQLLSIIGTNSTDGLREEEAGKASVVILRHLIDAPYKCDPNNTDSYDGNYINWLLGNRTDGEDDRHHLEERLEEVLSQLEEITGDHKDDDHMDGDHVDGDHMDGDHVDDDHVDDDHMDDDHKDDDHKEDGDHEDEHGQCFDARKVLAEVSDGTLEEMAENAALVTLAYIIEGMQPEPHCPASNQALPEDFITSLYAHLGMQPGQKFGLNEFELLMAKLNIGEHDDHEDEEEEDTQDGHAHAKRKKRSVPSSSIEGVTLTRSKRAADMDKVTSPTNVSNTCYSAEELLSIYGVAHSDDISQTEFGMICPSLLQQYVSGACVENEKEMTAASSVSDAQKYGYGCLAVLLISLCALLGLIFAPCYSARWFHHMMSFMIALAVGTLSSDALIHLLPEAFGLHGHDEDSHGHGAEEGFMIEVEPFMYKSLLVLAAIYVFFILESLLETGRNGMGHSHGPAGDVDVESSELHENKINGGFSGEHTKSSMNNGSTSSQNLTKYAETSDGIEGDFRQPKGCCGVKSVGWMVILGDAIHNFADGLAIGAAFSLSVSGGISTSLAVLCHELPHELGDFAILLNSGMSLKKAAFFNFLSAVTAFGGLFVGLALSSDGEARVWIFTVAAGMFLYIALADMIPEMIAMQKSGFRCQAFLLQNLGFLVGVGILVVLALFEEQIRV